MILLPKVICSENFVYIIVYTVTCTKILSTGVYDRRGAASNCHTLVSPIQASQYHMHM